MVSINAQNVAKKVLENVRKGKKINLGDIIEANGYTKTTSTVPSQVTNTKSYQNVINPIVEKWERERERLTNELLSRDLSDERYETVMKSMDILTKNIQLISGKPTENITINELTSEEKNSLLNLLDK